MTYGAGAFEYSGRLARKALSSARALEVRPDLIARALETLARLELFRGRLEESAAYAEEGAELSRELAERPSPPEAPSFDAYGHGAHGLVESGQQSHGDPMPHVSRVRPGLPGQAERGGRVRA
jgi:hypothetical protein